jgi:hypothetical protein
MTDNKKWLNELVSTYKIPSDERKTGILKPNQVNRILQENTNVTDRKSNGNN